ncbi:MAG: F-type H+-transporting ATPase subunit alpha [Microgenomates group bacterium LiPW_16]|nr:MAG: F-type H+-transporting ATPase subunit alpha [Microgenomates group bacterium LiPW_16]
MAKISQSTPQLKRALGEIFEKIEKAQVAIAPSSVGKILKIGDGVAQIEGLPQVGMGEILEFPKGCLGLALNLEEKTVGAIILGEYQHLQENDLVFATGRMLEIPVSEELIGRVIDPLGRPLDNKGPVFKRGSKPVMMPLEKVAPSVTARQPVNTPLQTGICAIDSIIPIGRGQRELIIGDRGTGKTALVLDTIINQKNENIVCIYVAIGQKTAQIAQVVDKLSEYQALEHTIVVAASASDPVSLQYLAPYAGCAIGEYFKDKGKDAVVFYDDLLKHAWAYRQISLILRRPSGREAYPGDIFYLHSRLLERACRMADRLRGGSLTAIPIIETQAGDISAYIPTNVISITDGQIYLEPDLFHAGIRPAINVGLSVSRVGGAAQLRAMKQVVGNLRLEMASYRELAAFTQFAAELDPTTRAQIERGARLTEVLKQPQFAPLPVEKQVIVIWAATSGFLDDLPLEKIRDFKEKYLVFMETNHPGLLGEIRTQKILSDETVEKLKKVTEEFKTKFS